MGIIRGELTMSDYEYQQLENSSMRLAVHIPEKCETEVCTIHKRTDHSMRRYPQMWRTDMKMMYRVCPHHLFHPDPDEYKIVEGIVDGVHECDGCCIQFSDVEPEYNKIESEEDGIDN
jgi:hypothetical protein